MARFFNTAGPNDPADHYTLPALGRLPDVRRLIERKLYFVLHAPRQVGKTTTLLSFASELLAEGTYAAVLLSMEQGAPYPSDVGAAEEALLDAWRDQVQVRLPADLQPPPWPDAKPGNRIAAALRAWAEASPRPLVVFLDEIDALQDDALLSVLRQLRAAYPNRPEHFPSSLALIGLRDVRDYKIGSDRNPRLGTASPFNIKAESLTLHNFTRDEVAALYAQHTDETGQAFLPEAVTRAFELTRGQPWLVNALAQQLTDVLVTDRARAITAAEVDRARDLLIERQDTHLDSLVDKLRDPRIRAIIEPMIAGGTLGALPEDDLRYAVDLGLVYQTREGGLDAANPMYREIMVRSLASGVRASLPQIQPTWLGADGQLDTGRLLDAFLAFWRQHGEALLGAAPYHEIAPHLVLMAFLHRVVNGGGTIEREYAIGRGRMDLCVRYAAVTLAIEIKVWRRGTDPEPVGEGLEQLDGYLAGLGSAAGWLVIFDRRSEAPRLAERMRTERGRTPGGREVVVVRL